MMFTTCVLLPPVSHLFPLSFPQQIENEGADETFVARFTDSTEWGFDSDEAKAAMSLFEAEVNALVNQAKMPRADAQSLGVHTAASSVSQATTRKPVLAEGEEDTTENYERIFEEEYDGAMPKVLVGLEFPARLIKVKQDVFIPFWEFVLRKLSERLLEDGAKGSRELLNLEKAEQEMGKGTEE